MNSYLALSKPNIFVAYTDVGEGRELGAASFEDFTNSQLLAAIFALILSLLSTIYFVQNRSATP